MPASLVFLGLEVRSQMFGHKLLTSHNPTRLLLLLSDPGAISLSSVSFFKLEQTAETSRIFFRSETDYRAVWGIFCNAAESISWNYLAESYFTQTDLWLRPQVRKYVYHDADNLDTAFDAGGKVLIIKPSAIKSSFSTNPKWNLIPKVSIGLTATTIVSQWTWSATLLQSSTVASKVSISTSWIPKYLRYLIHMFAGH